MDAGGTSPRMGEGRTMQEQLSRATQEQLPRTPGKTKISNHGAHWENYCYVTLQTSRSSWLFIFLGVLRALRGLIYSKLLFGIVNL